MVKLIKELWTASVVWLESKVPKPFKDFLAKYPLTGAGLAIVGIPAAYWFGSVSSPQNQLVDAPTQPASLTAAADKTDDFSPRWKAIKEANEILSQGGAERFIFTASWSPRVSDSYSIGEDGAISIEEGANSARFDYGGKVPRQSNFGFSFASEGIYGPNVVVARPEFWEVVVGDKSDRVITLKATDKLGGDLFPIEELNWEKLRPESNALRPRVERCVFESGEEIRVEVSEQFLTDTKQFKVDITVTCNDMSSDTLSWVFTPPPKWPELEQVYLAIVDLDGENHTKIHFINPPIVDMLLIDEE